MSSKVGVFGGGVGSGPCTNTQLPSIIYENFRGLFSEEPFVTSKAHAPRYLTTNALIFWGFYEYLHIGVLLVLSKCKVDNRMQFFHKIGVRLCGGGGAIMVNVLVMRRLCT